MASKLIRYGLRSMTLNTLRVVFRVSDPHWFNADPDTDPDPAFFLIADPDPGSRSRVWWSEIEKIYNLKFNFFFSWSKIAIYLSLGLHKGRPSYRRSLPEVQKMKILSFFFNLLGHFCSPGTGSGSAICMRIRIQQLKLMRIRIQIRNPGCFRCFYSGFWPKFLF